MTDFPVSNEGVDWALSCRAERSAIQIPAAPRAMLPPSLRKPRRERRSEASNSVNMVRTSASRQEWRADLFNQNPTTTEMQEILRPAMGPMHEPGPNCNRGSDTS